MLLLSTLVISPVALTASAAGQHGITINHIFSDGYNAANSYDELYGSYEEGETPLVTVIAPQGYIIEDVYFTTPSGADFSLFVEDLQYDNPVQGVYHITMPDYDLEMNVIYRCILNSAVVNHIYDGGHSDDADYQVIIDDEIAAGDAVVFNVDPKAGYAVDTIYVLGYAGTSFATLLDLPIENIGANSYRLTMPDQPITINVVYTANRHDITPVALFDGAESADPETYYNGPATADPGETVVFYGAEINGYSAPEVFVTAGAGMDFVEVVELEEIAGAYSFVMPDAPVTVHLIYSNTEYGITSANIFEDGNDDDTVYYDGADTAVVGERVFFTVANPDGYTLKEIYGVMTAGTAFVEVFPIDSIAGAYYFDMPEGEVKICLVYAKSQFTITAVNVFEDGTVDDTDYYVGPDSANVGDKVIFTVEAPQGYAVSEIFGTYETGDAFVEVFALDSIAGAYYFDMPEGNVTLTVDFTATLFDIDFVSYKGSEIADQWTVEDIAVGSTFVFAGNAPAGYAVEDVFALATISDTFVEVIDVEDLGNGSYSFTMPAAKVDVVIIYKSVLFDVNYASYDGTDVVAEWTDTGVMVGDKHIFAIDVPDGYAVEDVIATTAVNGLFVEVLNVGNLAGAYYFTMPEADVDVTVVLKKITFNVTINDLVNGQVIETETVPTDAGTTAIIIATAPAGYEDGYVINEITAVSAADETVSYDLVAVGENVYSFEMPEDDVIVNIDWKANMFKVTVSNVDESGLLISSREINNNPAGSETSVTLEAPGADYMIAEYYIVAEIAPFHEFIDAALVGDTTLTFTQPEADVDVTIVWRRNAYTVTERYIVNETEVLDDLTAEWNVRPGDNWISLSTVPEGYEVSELYVTAMDGAFGEPLDFIRLNDLAILFVVPDGDVFVDYYLTKIVNNVNYYAYVDGELAVVKNEEVEYGEKAVWGKDNAADNLPDGHAFVAWYLGAAEYDFETAVTGDIDLFAVYEFASCTVSFNSDGGSDVASQTVIKGGKAVEPAAPEKEGYDFAGWQLNGAAYDFSAEVTADIELTATWTEKTYTVTLPTSVDYEVKTADGYDTTVKYDGSYAFTVEYADGVDGENAVVTANGETLTPDASGLYTVENIKSDVYISVNVAGTQEPVLYTVRFNYFHGDDAVSVANVVAEGGSVTAPADTDRYAYRFLGWYDNAEGTGEAVTDFTNITADAEYFAVYEQNPLADYTFGEHTVTDSAYGIGFKEVKIEVVKNDAGYMDRDVYVIAAAQLKDGSTVLFYVPVYVEKGEAKADVSLILNSNTFEYVDMYIVYDEVDLSGSLNWIDIESGIQVA